MTDLILLHGALASKDQLQPLAKKLNQQHKVHLFSLRGHGGLELPKGGYSFDHFSEDITGYMEENKIAKANFFGYSMGGYAAASFAIQYPDKVDKIITLGTKWIWDKDSTEAELKQLNTDLIEQKVPRFAQMLADTHAPNDWKVVVEKTALMMKDLSRKPVIRQEDFRSLEHPMLIGVGDQDQTARPADTLTVFQMLLNSQLWVIPNTPHPLHKVRLDELADQIRRFLV